MQLSQTERERLSAILEQYDHHPKVQEMREFIQHGDVTTYQHCKNVVVVSCWICLLYTSDITKKEQNVIASHMWPLTFRHIPTCREAVIVCLADKYCAIVESMFRRTRVGADGEEW